MPMHRIVYFFTGNPSGCSGLYYWCMDAVTFSLLRGFSTYLYYWSKGNKESAQQKYTLSVLDASLLLIVGPCRGGRRWQLRVAVT